MKSKNVSDLIDIEIVIDVKGERVSMQYQILTDITKELVRYIFTGENATLFESKENYSVKGAIVTNTGADKLIYGKDSLCYIVKNNTYHKFQNKAA